MSRHQDYLFEFVVMVKFNSDAPACFVGLGGTVLGYHASGKSVSFCNGFNMVPPLVTPDVAEIGLRGLCRLEMTV